MKPIHTTHAPEVVGPYSQAIEANGFIFCSGQIGLNPKTGKLAHGINAQTKQVLANIHAVLTEADLGPASVVKTTVYLASIDDYKQMNEVYATFFKKHRPARAAFAVAALPAGALVEIEALAFKPGPCGCNSQTRRV
jgi:2-iminobutanoate/2-iminopropanoate deaminase